MIAGLSSAANADARAGSLHNIAELPSAPQGMRAKILGAHQHPDKQRVGRLVQHGADLL